MKRKQIIWSCVRCGRRIRRRGVMYAGLDYHPRCRRRQIRDDKRKWGNLIDPAQKKL